MTRCTILPVNLNANAAGGVFPLAPAAGIDAAGAGGAAFGTTWASGPYQGVQFANNGQMILWIYNGATAGGASEVLIGGKVAGQVFPHTTLQYTITATNYHQLGPWSPQDFNQQDAAAHAASLGGAIGAGGVGMTCVDFTTITTIAVRLYQLIPVKP
jgi:hypothetical protein